MTEIMLVPANATSVKLPVFRNGELGEEDVSISEDEFIHKCDEHDLWIQRGVDLKEIRALLTRWEDELVWYRENSSKETPRAVGISWLEEHISDLKALLGEEK